MWELLEFHQYYGTYSYIYILLLIWFILKNLSKVGTIVDHCICGQVYLSFEEVYIIIIITSVKCVEDADKAILP